MIMHPKKRIQTMRSSIENKATTAKNFFILPLIANAI
jgi:hypothetical protein